LFVPCSAANHDTQCASHVTFPEQVTFKGFPVEGMSTSTTTLTDVSFAHGKGAGVGSVGDGVGEFVGEGVGGGVGWNIRISAPGGATANVEHSVLR
jgi:hypothetical protein